MNSSTVAKKEVSTASWYDLSRKPETAKNLYVVALVILLAGAVFLALSFKVIPEGLWRNVSLIGGASLMGASLLFFAVIWRCTRLQPKESFPRTSRPSQATRGEAPKVVSSSGSSAGSGSPVAEPTTMSSLPKELQRVPGSWMVLDVSPYKPMGHFDYECSQDAYEIWRASEPRFQHITGNERQGAIQAIKNDLFSVFSKKFSDDQNMTRIDDNRYYCYHGASFEILHLNRSTIEREAQNDPQWTEILKLMDDKNPSKNAFAFYRALTAGTISSFRQLMIDVLFADPSLSEATLSMIQLPKHGVNEIIELQKQFPRHYWPTIRNLLFGFSQDPNSFEKVKGLLGKLPPMRDRVYCRVNGTLYFTDANSYIQ